MDSPENVLVPSSMAYAATAPPLPVVSLLEMLPPVEGIWFHRR